MKDLIKLEALKVKPSKRYIARNTKSAKVLEELSNDSDLYVRCSVVYNTNCPVEILEKLSNNSDWYVRYCVAGNSNCPVEILEKFCKDYDSKVRNHANQRLNRIGSTKS